MATPRPPKVVLSERERAELERLVRAFTTGQQLALRARIVLAAGDGLNNLQIARELGVDDETPSHWRGRWLAFREVPLEEGPRTEWVDPASAAAAVAAPAVGGVASGGSTSVHDSADNQPYLTSCP